MMKFLRRLFGIKPKQMYLVGMHPPAMLVPRATRSPAMPPVAPPLSTRRVSSFAMSPAPVPMRSNQDDDMLAGLGNAMLMQSAIASSGSAECARDDGHTIVSGRGGDFAGGGAEASWSSSPAPSYDSGGSYSSDSSSSSSSSDSESSGSSGD